MIQSVGQSLYVSNLNKITFGTCLVPTLLFLNQIVAQTMQQKRDGAEWREKTDRQHLNEV